MGKRKPSQKQQNINSEYKKVRAKILKRFKSLEERGYSIKLTIPKVPKKKTEASIRLLETFTLERLYKRSTYHGFASYGEEVSGVKGKQLEQKQRAQKAKETRKQKKFKKKTEKREMFDESFYVNNTIDRWYRQVYACINGSYAKALIKWMDTLILQNGKYNVSKMINDGEAIGIVFTFEVTYKYEAFNRYTSELIHYLPDQDELYYEDIEEYKQELVIWADLAEEEEEFFNE